MWIVSSAVIKLVLISLLGFILSRKRVIEQKTLQFLTFFVINLTIPFLIFSHFLENAHLVRTHAPWNFLLLSVAIFGTGALLAQGARLLPGRQKQSEITSLAGFQNSGYLPMNLALFLFPAALREEFLVYIFFYLLGFNVIMWSLGSFFIFKREGEEFRLRSLFTPPVSSTILAVIFVWLGISEYVPRVVLYPMKMIGDTSFVLSMLILGCWLARVRLGGAMRQLASLGLVTAVKLFVLPGIFLAGLVYFRIYSLFGTFVILEAAMPSAASLPIVADMRRADSEFVSQGVLVTHLFSIFTIPLWLGLYLRISGFSW
ncbi:MAG: hypothetical protein GF333_07100 [Candidatus Omnitrophica bacterium]|nr:hypothetical protein [Candidatus Omnitrophota bacterium]